MNFSLDITSIAILALSIIILVLAICIMNLYTRLNKFLLGNKAENLDESISIINKSIKDLESFRGELEEYLAGVEKRLRRSTQSVHTVRFNPFQGVGNGGNQSFATAFINENGDGVIISSLYSREHVSIFSKPIKKGGSEYELSEEEKKAIKEAIESTR
ncbi:MAG TPA: DUF4446 family protein [Candidatus Paceibacterota bacterium]